MYDTWPAYRWTAWVLNSFRGSTIPTDSSRNLVLPRVSLWDNHKCLSLSLARSFHNSFYSYTCGVPPWRSEWKNPPLPTCVCLLLSPGAGNPTWNGGGSRRKQCIRASLANCHSIQHSCFHKVKEYCMSRWRYLKKKKQESFFLAIGLRLKIWILGMSSLCKTL